MTWVATIALLSVLGYLGWKSDYQAKLPQLPVSVQFRRALLGPGYVLRVNNTSSQPLQVMATVTHPAVNDSRRFDLYIAANGYSEVGKLSGWTTEPGDQIKLENSNYRPWNGSIP